LQIQAYRSNPDRGFVSTSSPRRFIQSFALAWPHARGVMLRLGVWSN
jgi:hypothetical protein